MIVLKLTKFHKWNLILFGSRKKACVPHSANLKTELLKYMNANSQKSLKCVISEEEESHLDCCFMN